ncbi:unnamed protein product, partial [Mesorhabditis belari]|uniref:CDGSH iron-sulfur domain-containing protein 2 homologue n=1 Tax=Mesorhabditis belari TaxID=2138241 RepID=A0AAF3EWT7_9BILA
MADATHSIYRQRGLRGFTCGIQARVMYQIPAAALSWSVYELFKFVLGYNEAKSKMTDTASCHLSKSCVLTSAALVLGGVAIGYGSASLNGIFLVLLGLAVGTIISYFTSRRNVRVNCTHKLECDKVVDTVDMEDIGDKKTFCRCWKSSKFPYCDGTHNKHNKETGDNVGPLIVQKSKQ